MLCVDVLSLGVLSRIRGISGISELQWWRPARPGRARSCNDANPVSLPAGDTMSLINFLETLSEPLKRETVGPAAFQFVAANFAADRILYNYRTITERLSDLFYWRSRRCDP